MPESWFSWIKDNTWTIAVGASILFFIILALFYHPISKWLQGRQDFSIGTPTVLKQALPGKYKNEEKCREVFERFLQRPFPKARPDFLRRANGRCLELDGYNRDLKLAFEYNGIQHSRYWPRFHRSYKDFEEQVQRDKDKAEMCSKAKPPITLIVIPHTIPYLKLEGYIRDQLRNHRFL